MLNSHLSSHCSRLRMAKWSLLLPLVYFVPFWLTHSLRLRVVMMVDSQSIWIVHKSCGRKKRVDNIESPQSPHQLIHSNAVGTGPVRDSPRADAEEERRLRLGALRAPSARWSGCEPTTGRSVHQSSSQVRKSERCLQFPTINPQQETQVSVPIHRQFAQHFRNAGEEQQQKAADNSPVIVRETYTSTRLAKRE